MENKALIQIIQSDFAFNKVERTSFEEFLTKNGNLPEQEFYKKLLEEFPWLDVLYKHHNSKFLKNISKRMDFFYKLSIAYLILTGIAIIIIISFLSNTPK